MSDLDELLAKLGSSDKAARDLIELGEPALAAVDAIAADATRPLEQRTAASLIGHQIRDRAMRAPAAPASTPQLGDAFHSRYEVAPFLASLRAAGAVTAAIERDSVIVVELPEDAAARARLFAMYNAEVDELDQEFGGEPTAGHEMTREEAIALGAPEAEGEWVVDDFHVVDTGQRVLRFWWD